MNVKLLLLIISIAAFGSCNVAYKTGQTPDDVYYSPAPPVYDEVKSEQEENKTEEKTVYRDDSDDRDIRAKIRNRRFRYEDDYVYNNYYPYNYNRYSYSPYYYNYYNPYYIPTYYYSGPKTNTQVKYYTPRKFNLGAYNPVVNNRKVNLKTGLPEQGSAPVRTFKKTSSNPSLGNTIRKIILPSRKTNSSGNDNNTYTPVRTFDTPSSNNSGNNKPSSSSSPSPSSSGSGSTSVPVRTFNK